MLELVLYFSLLSLLSIGGVAAVMPEVHRFAVDVQGWVTAREFTRLFAIAQAAPGPNVLISSLIGWRVAGLTGAVAALAAMCGPSSILAWYVGDLWHRFREAHWRKVIQRGLAPLTVGLISAGGFVIATPPDSDWRLWSIAALATLGAYFLKTNPLWILLAGGLAGVALL